MTSEIGNWHIAGACHEAHRRFCMALGEDVPPVWEDVPVWMRHSALTNVRIQLENPKISAAERHWRWVQESQLDGWSLGPKDPEAKTHPNLRPFAELPRHQQIKGEMFGAIVEALRDVR